jgi:rhomboid protease GluP
LEYRVIIYWLLVFTAALGFLGAIRILRSGGIISAVLYSIILVLCGLGKITGRFAFVDAALAFWGAFIVFPAYLTRRYSAVLLRQNYRKARRIALAIRCLHPFGPWREIPGILRALELAEQGDPSLAKSMLESEGTAGNIRDFTAKIQLYRVLNLWEDLARWHSEHARQLESQPQFIPIRLRIFGETGDLDGLVNFYRAHQSRIARLAPFSYVEHCRLMLFAFGGRPELVEAVLDGSLAMMPATSKEFWIATAKLMSGATEEATTRLEKLRGESSAPLRDLISRRLAMPLPSPGARANAEALIQRVLLEWSHDDRFGGQRSFFSKHARACQIILGLNLLMFALEIRAGGSTDQFALYRLGALVPIAVREGQWWRLVSSLFLHFGPVHLLMNMLALWFLGPFTEFALGFKKFLLVYFVAGIGSMSIVMRFASGPHGEQITVGASGSLMGLVGATGALMLKGWLRQKATIARRRLFDVIMIVILQTMFDSIVPHVSMAAHLSGVVLGFAATLFLQDRFSREA